VKLCDAQDQRREFIERSKNRSRQRKILREMFQSGEMPVAMFNHLTHLTDAEQRRDEKTSGYHFQQEL
jgi:hypothetical protein